MLFDFNEAWSRIVERRYDVCICGTGPSGITVARKLAARGKSVLLLEGGGLSFTSASQDHYKGKSVGPHPFWWFETARLRYFGGSSNCWTGVCSLMDPVAFEPPRDEGRLPGWPISRDELIRGLDEAKEILDVPNANFSRSKYPDFDSPSFDRFPFALSPPTRFFEKYGAEIRQSKQIDAFYNANLVDLRLTDDLSSVVHVSVRNYNNKIVDVSTPQYVMALHAIENARMLLNTNKQVPSGLGNNSGMVGRCFMESLNAPIGRFLVTDPDFWQRGTDGSGHRDIALVMTEDLIRQKDINSGVINYTAGSHPESYGRLRVLKEFLRDTACFSPAVTELSRRFADFDCPGDGIIHSLIEQEANPNSRITLTDEVDSFGLRRVQLNWEFTARDYKTIRTLAIESAKEMARLNRARVQLAPFILDPNLEIKDMGVNMHHMGTTRMSADPRHGVVNENCQVHGIRNLYIAGSSVFPRCGGRNPTLAIVLIALRLGNFLSSKS
jgi:hypothetical protein